ncbi:hypothetical protein FJ365_01095 [Candidatus Dependentiae bacterium]|nr:hypothetical protein [Candidatus Dependentiae bacterium]
MQNVTKLIALIGLIATGTHTAANAVVTAAAADASLDSISTRAFHICQNVSIKISEDAITKQVMVQAKGDWPLLTWLSREKKNIRSMIDRLLANSKTPVGPQTASIDSDLIRVIVLKTVPLVQQILTDVLQLDAKEAAVFWQAHGNRITTEAQTVLCSWLTNKDDVLYIKNMLEQENFNKFMHIIAQIIKNQLNAASHLKASVSALRNDIRAAAAA